MNLLIGSVTVIKLRCLVLVICLSGIFQTSCNSPRQAVRKAYRQMSTAEKQLADSLLSYALDHEAIYTLLDTLKPISSVKFYQWPVLSNNRQQRDSAINAVRQVQTVLNKLSVGDHRFVLNPFERTDSIYRNMEIYVVRKSRIQSLIRQYGDFYGRFGITENSHPATVLALTEYEHKYDRWRSYGYLFGYPGYAVDFFVAAGKSQDSTKEFVKRDFFHIPVYSGNSGYFTYAMPKGHQPGAADSAIYYKAMHTLDEYKSIRNKFSSRSGMKATKLWIKQLKK